MTKKCQQLFYFVFFGFYSINQQVIKKILKIHFSAGSSIFQVILAIFSYIYLAQSNSALCIHTTLEKQCHLRYRKIKKL